jgi:hypothetical protein
LGLGLGARGMCLRGLLPLPEDAMSKAKQGLPGYDRGGKGECNCPCRCTATVSSQWHGKGLHQQCHSCFCKAGRGTGACSRL